ncbi:MAG TPA: hypothetical protein VM582_03960, partial [Candidatus Thermoplasmatota archaeon]|nr:hypothetical protein [Candidatus Thermoplasmatota archaeon]
GGPEDEDRYFANPRPNAGPREVVVPDGYTGPAREPYLSYFEGVWLYGSVTATPLARQWPIDLDVDGDWAVWEDANRSDIYAYNIPSGEGFYILNDAYQQHHPRVSNGVVVFEDHRTPRPAIYAYFLETGEMRRLSNTTRGLTNPSIDYPYVAWLDDNITNPDVWVYSLLNNTAWNVHPGTDRDSDPVVVDRHVYWRTYRYNLWDIMGYDIERDEYVQVTTDAAIQSAPFSNGKEVLYLTNQYEMGWRLERFDPAHGIARRTNIRLPDSGFTSASGDAILRATLEVDYSQLVIRNMSNGASNHVSGNLLLVGEPVLRGNTVFAIARTTDGTSLVMLEVSPFAFLKRPTLTITSPPRDTPWLRPIVVSGLLSAGDAFAEPTTFTYRLDDQPPQIIPPGKNWRFTLDPNGVAPGPHLVTIRATFREGPPVETSVTLVIPAPSQSVDVERAGPAFHAARLLGELQVYVLDNPGAWFLIPLLLLLLVLAALRVWLWFKPRRERGLVEYVYPDEA